jgi:hypothetical protein
MKDGKPIIIEVRDSCTYLLGVLIFEMPCLLKLAYEKSMWWWLKFLGLNVWDLYAFLGHTFGS